MTLCLYLMSHIQLLLNGPKSSMDRSSLQALVYHPLRTIYKISVGRQGMTYYRDHVLSQVFSDEIFVPRKAYFFLLIDPLTVIL